MAIQQGDNNIRTCTAANATAFSQSDNESTTPIAVRLAGSTASNSPYPVVRKPAADDDDIYGLFVSFIAKTNQVTVAVGGIQEFEAEGAGIDLTNDIGKGIDAKGTSGEVKAATSGGRGVIVGGRSTTRIYVDLDSNAV